MDWSTLKISVKKFARPVKRWNVELLLLGVILIPIWLFIFWINDTVKINADEILIKKSLVGIVTGVLGLSVWILGASVIIINLLREILAKLDSISKRE